MLTGYVKHSTGLEIGETRVGEVLRQTFPRNNQQRRQNTARAINPIPYRADYFGHKLHMDQNEKLVMYGCTHVLAIDGHSRFIVANSTMPVKNNLRIYDEVYR